MANDFRSVGQDDVGLVRNEIDRRDASLRQGQNGLRAVGVDAHNPELVKTSVAGVELAVGVGIEYRPQRLHVRCRCRVPIGKVDFLASVDFAVAVAVGVDRENAIAKPGPGHTRDLPVAIGVEELVGLAEPGDLDAVAVEVEKDGFGVAAVSAATASVRRSVARAGLCARRSGGITIAEISV